VAWLGHTEQIALDHYLQTDDTDFAKAIGTSEQAAQIPAQCDPVSQRTDRELVGAESHASPDFAGNPACHESVQHGTMTQQNAEMGAPGFEPGTKGL
jgi:hypothetical protein